MKLIDCQLLKFNHRIIGSIVQGFKSAVQSIFVYQYIIGKHIYTSSTYKKNLKITLPYMVSSFSPYNFNPRLNMRFHIYSYMQTLSQPSSHKIGHTFIHTLSSQISPSHSHNAHPCTSSTVLIQQQIQGALQRLPKCLAFTFCNQCNGGRSACFRGFSVPLRVCML